LIDEPWSKSYFGCRGLCSHDTNAANCSICKLHMKVKGTVNENKFKSEVKKSILEVITNNDLCT